jgi:hypothetical protein
MPAVYLDQLRSAAEASEGAEAEFRRYAERRLEALKTERVRAYRRYHLVKDMVESARPVADRATCIAVQIACVLVEAGWSESDAAYGEVRERLGRVAALVHGDLHAEGTPEAIFPALRAFESWYRDRFGTEFSALLPRTQRSFVPLVDF